MYSRKIHPKNCRCRKCSHKTDEKYSKRLNYLLVFSVLLIGLLA